MEKLGIVEALQDLVAKMGKVIEKQDKEIDFLARTIKGCPTFLGYYKNCKGECQTGGVNSMSECWKEIAKKAVQA